MKNMDYVILILLITLLIYMIVRDVIVSKKRRENRIRLKRISRKFDTLTKEAKSQSRLFTQLLDILSEDESN